MKPTAHQLWASLFLKFNLGKRSKTMIVCHKSDHESQCRSGDDQDRRPFVCTPYVPDKQDRYRPVEGIPQCPWADGGKRCVLKKHAWRERKTGPCVPLRLMYCRSHGRHFTLYPIGHVPYSRRCVVPTDLAGHSVKSLEDNNKASAGPPFAAHWEGSWFRGGPGCCLGSAVAP